MLLSKESKADGPKKQQWAHEVFYNWLYPATYKKMMRTKYIYDALKVCKILYISMAKFNLMKIYQYLYMNSHYI